MELDPQTHIYFESMLPGEYHKHIYMATPHSVFKMPKIVLLPEKKKELSYRPKTLVCRHNLTLQITRGGSHLTTPFPRCVRLIMSKNGNSTK